MTKLGILSKLLLLSNLVSQHRPDFLGWADFKQDSLDQFVTWLGVKKNPMKPT